MLTRDRPELARRAVECFRAQTYEPKELLIYDTGDPEWSFGIGGSDIFRAGDFPGASIGVLRNRANTLASGDILIHWDDDDYSHPSRIAEQVAHLQQSGADVVGYNELLFWRVPYIADQAGTWEAHPQMQMPTPQPGAAWLYSNRDPRYAVGTSFCYWRKTWERKPFRDLPRNKRGRGEDTEFLTDLKCEAISAMRGGPDCPVCDPRMIARIHGGNTMPYAIEQQIAGGSKEWKRVPEWDERVGRILA